MTRAEAWLVHLANLLVGGTGLAYAALLYLVEPADPFAVVHHPLQPDVQHAHVWTAPLLVFTLGLVFRGHAWANLRSAAGARRRSGVALLALAAPMVLSGYLLQTAVEPAWRAAWSLLHLGSSGLWVISALLHLPRGLRRGSLPPPESERMAP